MVVEEIEEDKPHFSDSSEKEKSVHIEVINTRHNNYARVIEFTSQISGNRS